VDFKETAGQITGLWTSLSVRQRLSILVAAVSVAATLFMFSGWRKEKDFRPLFSNMTAEDAGSIVDKLKESGVEYRVGENGSSVLVPSSRVAEIRLQMATAGLPRTGRIGFELFDKTSLGTTDFAEQVNYRRALEGEIERSIRSLSEVEVARVHLSFPKDSVFLESQQPAKASVLLRLRQGAQLTPANVTAIAHLVSSAVEGLTPDAVSITDSQGNLLNRPRKPQDFGGATDEQMEYRQKVERDLTGKVNSTLEPLVGPGRYRVGLSVDCDFTSGEQSEELYDPEKSVMVTTQKSEETTGTASSGGVPGTASSLPRPAPRTASGTLGISRRSENVTYQSSRTIRKTRLPQGSVKRISASVLLDQDIRWEVRDGKQQKVLVPPSPESVNAIHEVVAAALGLVPSRGDQLVIQSLPFESTLETAPPPLPTSTQGTQQKEVQSPFVVDWKNWRLWTGVAGAIIVLSALVLWFRKRKKRRASVAMKPELAAPARQEALASVEVPMLDGAPDTGRLLSEAQERVVQTVRVETLVEELRSSVAHDPELAASVLRTWLEETEA
jgi:flagellar M-ring protein FliF